MKQISQIEGSYRLGLVMIVVIFCGSCQRQLHFDEQLAEGFLKRDTNGNCAPVVTSGVYSMDTMSWGNNFIELEVEVTREGTYTISSDTVNGYWFSVQGRFDRKGTERVKLLAKGKAQLAGQNNFTIRFNGSTCSTSITVLDAGPLDFTIPGGSVCSNVLVEGDYIKGRVLGATNKLKVKLMVVVPGYYSINMNGNNGYGFSGAGILSSTGEHTIQLYASGTPQVAGTDVFTLASRTSSCSFDVIVANSDTLSHANHFPLSDYSSWVYNDLQFPGDSITRSIRDSVVINSKWYLQINEKDRMGNKVIFLRRDGNNYYENALSDKYTTALTFSPQFQADIPFLKENLTAGQTWASPHYTGTVSGQPKSLRYTYLCTHDNATVIVNGRTFEKVYKVEVRPQVAAGNNAFSYTGELYEYYYADGIGMIYFRKTQNSVTTMQANIRSWIVY